MSPAPEERPAPPADRATVTVRPFQPSDAEAVSRIFTAGMAASIMPQVLQNIKDPLFLAIAGGSAALSAALALSGGDGDGGAWWDAARGALTAAALAVAAVGLWMAQSMAGYIQQSVSGDLADVEAFYMNNPAAPASCFWVAEACLQPPPATPGGADHVTHAAALPRQPSADGSAPAAAGAAQAEAAAQPEQGQPAAAALAAAAAPMEAPAAAGEGARFVVGCVALQDLGGGRGELRRMSVAAPWQRRGVGEALGRALLERARAQGLRGVVLTTVAANARRIYQRLGWQQTGSGFMLEGVPVTWYTMERVLEGAADDGVVSGATSVPQSSRE